MKALIVGGTFDLEGGRPSKIAAVIAQQARNLDHNVSFCNGGRISDISPLLGSAEKFDAFLWFPKIPNDFEKNISSFKRYNPTSLLVSSKRNDGSKYSFKELVNHALGLKANLTVEFSRFGSCYHGRVFDPLGNVWTETDDFVSLTNSLFDRIKFLRSLTRVSSTCLNHEEECRVSNACFLELVKSRAETFHDLIHPADGVTRFLGNASFRCERGFPSFKTNNAIFVSRRNVDKRYLDENAFVCVESLANGNVGYYGSNKPSVDAPIQLRLYDMFPKVRFMMHAHAYVLNAPFTSRVLPCGAIEEFKEIVDTFIRINTSTRIRESGNFMINLKSHGSIVCGSTLAYLSSAEYYARELPEIQL